MLRLLPNEVTMEMLNKLWKLALIIAILVIGIKTGLFVKIYQVVVRGGLG